MVITLNLNGHSWTIPDSKIEIFIETCENVLYGKSVCGTIRCYNCPINVRYTKKGCFKESDNPNTFKEILKQLQQHIHKYKSELILCTKCSNKNTCNVSKILVEDKSSVWNKCNRFKKI